jgi:hypothetical protein
VSPDSYTEDGQLYDYKTVSPPQARREPDAHFGPGEDPRPTLPGFVLSDHNWDEKTGVTRLTYRNKITGERVVCDAEQPAGPQHAGWMDRPTLNYKDALKEYFASVKEQCRVAELVSAWYYAPRDADAPEIRA